MRLVALLLLVCMAYVKSKEVFGSPSRRLCNLPYCLFQIALNLSFHLITVVYDRIFVKRIDNMVETVINYG